MIMDTPDKKQPRKHFFKIPANFYELSDEEQSAWTLQIAKVLHGEIVEGDSGGEVVLGGTNLRRAHLRKNGQSGNSTEQKAWVIN